MPENASGGSSSSSSLLIRGKNPRRCQAENPLKLLSEFAEPALKEMDFDNAVWSIPASKMKMKRPHRVPLSRQVLETLRHLQKLTGTGRYVFPSVRTVLRPLSENTLNAALRRLGYGCQSACKFDPSYCLRK
nr:tyrosine-type recombinase/integrase [Bradyrhizobium sp. 2S1]